ncbi:MAG TPA: hypothetical protein VFO25_08125 [Candidatus Eremiobacteraceae bacterium]|nr:hypothetical protein [Candidatus Eremiobacteraceae bacterium]
MPGKESFEDRLRRREESRKLEGLADATARAERDEAERFCYASAPAEANRLFDLIGEFVAKANAVLRPEAVPFAFARNSPEKVRRGIAAAEVMYYQLITNAGSQELRIVVYGASPVGSLHSMLPDALRPRVPRQRSRTLHPIAVSAKDGFAIRWRGGGESFLTSEQVAESIVEDVADFYDAVVRMTAARR